MKRSRHHNAPLPLIRGVTRGGLLLCALLCAGLTACRGGCSGGRRARVDAAVLRPPAERRVIKVGPPKAADLPHKMAAAQILITYRGATGAPPFVLRSLEEARSRAAKIAKIARKAPSNFEQLAIKYSEGPHSAEGGYLGSWTRGTMVPQFEAALSKLPAGGISSPVETPFGFHVIRRLRPLPATRVAASHLLVSYQGALRARPAVTRTRQQARARAEALLARLARDPKQFSALVRDYSDGPRADRFGRMGSWVSGRGNKPAVIDRVLLSLVVGQLSNRLVESPFGFHILKRTALQQRAKLSASHILIAYKGAQRAPATVTRSRAAARQLAAGLARRVQRKPGQFADFARKHSDDRSGTHGGYAGTWAAGDGDPQFERAVSRLKAGEISGPVETPAGFHIIRRHLIR